MQIVIGLCAVIPLSPYQIPREIDDQSPDYKTKQWHNKEQYRNQIIIRSNYDEIYYFCCGHNLDQYAKCYDDFSPNFHLIILSAQFNIIPQ